MTSPIFMALGSSIGNADEIFASAEQFLDKRGITVIQKSSIHQTKPFGGVAQNIFSNAVWEIQIAGNKKPIIETKASTITSDQIQGKMLLDSELSLENQIKHLFTILKQCEVTHGRDLNASRWSDRELDLDILMMGDVVGNFTCFIEDVRAYDHVPLQKIQLPHPGIPERDFVLKPWTEIIPTDFIIPTFGSIKKLLEDLK